MKHRLEARLDDEASRKLHEIVSRCETNVATWMKEVIDRAHAGLDREERRQAVRRIADAEVEDVPDPETLSRELAKAHQPRRP